VTESSGLFVTWMACVVTTVQRTGMLASAEDDIIDGEDDDDDLDASVETDEGVVTDDMPPPSPDEAVAESDAEKVSAGDSFTPYYTSVYTIYRVFYGFAVIFFKALLICLHCFDIVGWA